MKIVSVLSLALVLIGCGSNLSKSPKKAVGGEGQLCREDGTCNPMLICVEDRCQLPGDNNENVSPNITPNNENISPNIRPNNQNIRPNNQNVMNGFCGDGLRGPDEVCDGQDLDGETCITFGYEGGQLRCDSSCQLFDDSLCTIDTEPVCGDFIVEPPEACDANDLRGETCQSLGYAGGELRCGPDCLDFDVEGCFNAACGNGVLEQGEFCDGGVLGGATCESLGYDGGELRCNSACANYDVSDCTQCGNGVLEATEECDGQDLDGESCQSLGIGNGTLRCSNTCTYDVSQCADTPRQCALPFGCSIADEASCICEGCENDGVCDASDDCLCPDCENNGSCPDSQCNNDGACDPFNENCNCADCAPYPRCMTP